MNPLNKDDDEKIDNIDVSNITNKSKQDVRFHYC